MAKQVLSINNLHLVLISTDAEFIAQAQEALGTGGRNVGFVTLADTIDQALGFPEFDTASIVVADIDATQREQLLALQRMMIRLQGKGIPVVVLTETFDDEVARWLLQIRVTDFLRKPVKAADVIASCIRALKGLSGMDHQARVFALLPSAGGTGVTTLAIEMAMQVMQSSKLLGGATCLVDLDFQSGACADYLDLEPRFDLSELGPRGERLDQQLLDVMLSHHGSGLAILSAVSHPVQMPKIETNVVLKLLDLISSRFENVIIDMPRAWYPWTDDVISAADHPFIVTDMTVPGLRLARRSANAFLARFDNEVRPQILVNRFEKQSFFSTGLRHSDVARALEGFKFHAITNNYRMVREAIDRGVTLGDVKPGNTVSQDVRKIIQSARSEKI